MWNSDRRTRAPKRAPLAKDESGWLDSVDEITKIAEKKGCSLCTMYLYCVLCENTSFLSDIKWIRDMLLCCILALAAATSSLFYSEIKMFTNEINWCKMLLWNNRKKHSLNTIVKCSLAWMQYICSFESERKQIECFKTSSSATGAVTQNLSFHSSSSCVGLIVWEKAVSHPIFIFSLWFLFEFILILATLYHARAHHFIAHHFDLFTLWEAKKKCLSFENGSSRKLNHQQFFASPSRPLQNVCVCKLFQQSRRKGPSTKFDMQT